MGIPKLAQRVAVFGLFAFVLAVVQLDQASRSSGQLADMVPSGLGGFAGEKAALNALARDPLSAEEPIEDLLRARPVSAQHLSFFSIWAAEADRMDAAGQALNLASGRGWREPYVQLAVLASAVEQGDPETAAFRLDALTRAKRSSDIIFRAIDVMAADESGRDALRSRVPESDFLADQLIDYAEARPGQEVTAFSIFSAEDGEAMLTCDRRARLATTMLKRGVPEVREVLSPACGQTADGGYAFDPFLDETGPLDWTFPSSAGVSVREGLVEGTLTYNNRNLLQKLVAFRYALLPPGEHTARIVQFDSSQRPLSSGAGGDIEIRITCPASDGVDRRLILKAGYGTQGFTVPGDCPAQFIRFFASRGRGENVRLTLD